MNKLGKLIDECVRRAIYEGVFDKTATPHISKGDVRRDIGINPLRTDVGGHAAHDEVTQPSTITPDEEGFISQENIVISDNQLIIYKIKNFGNDKINGTMDFFGGSTVELARAINTMNGAARRNGKPLFYRTITSEGNKRASERTRQMVKTFWEFSFDGEEWYIMKPNPVVGLKISKFIKK
jgi:hypothetical protein